MKCIASPFHKDHARLMSEDPDLKFYEIQQKLRKIMDNKPVHVGIAILQLSKLHFLRFIYWLHEHLIPKSYILCYADTDSIFLGIYHYYSFIIGLLYQRAIFRTITRHHRNVSPEGVQKLPLTATTFKNCLVIIYFKLI